MLEAILNVALLLIEIILWTVFVIGIVRSDKSPPCDDGCNRCPFPMCDDERRNQK